MKAIIEIDKKGSAIRSARRQLTESQQGISPNFHLSFESAKSLFTELTPARLDLLDTLSKIAPCSIYALAKSASRNYSNVHTDVVRLEELCLIDRSEDGSITTLFEPVEIRMPLASRNCYLGTPTRRSST